MTTPAMDSAETSHYPSALPEISKPNSESPRPSALPPYFRSYEAYIEHCMAKIGPEGVPEAAFDRLCASCAAAFKKIAESFVGGGRWEKRFPFCSVNDFLRSAAEGSCHVCHSFMAERLKCNVPSLGDLLGLESRDSGVDAHGHGDAALKIYVYLHDDFPRSGHLQVSIVGSRMVFAGFAIEARDENSSRVRGFPTSLNTASDGSWNQALKWINNCLSHPLCNPVQTANLQDKRPARLVAVGTIGETYVRICETSRDGCTKEPYMTLSHCWGKKGVPIRLLEENYAGFLNGIQLGELPNTFRDAIELTRKLEIPYIWIDSLCIIQDSPGDKDWIRESAKMQEIYRNSFLNLAAAASFDSNGGLFNRRYPLSVVPWSVRVAENVYLTKKYTSEYPGIRAQKKLILYTRGWVLQEQLLARRTLVFGQDELHWECSTCQASESFPDSHEYSTDEVPYNIFRPGWENLLKGKPVDSDRQKAWNRLISTYSRRSLTKPSDRLMAISGLAEHLSSRWSGITYLAGLWSYRLIHELLWHCGSCSQRNMEIAPSWSWASLQERQSIGPSGITMCEDLGWLDVLAEVLEAKVTPKARTSPFGPVACGGSIRLRSPVIRARITIEDKRHRRYNLALEDNCNLDTLILQDVDVKWDDIDDAKADMKDAYFAPFEIQAYDKHDLATLHGLVLLKTAVHLLPCKTQLRRAGYFTRYDDGVSSDNDSENSCHDDGSDSGRDDASDESFQGGMDNNSEDASVTSSKDHELRWERSFRKRKKQGLFRNFNSWFAEKIGDGLEERMNYLKKDPYVNGPPLNTTLENRYLTEPGKEFLPDFSKFFEAIARVAQNNKANGTPDPVLGMGEGNGYYTYEIV